MQMASGLGAVMDVAEPTDVPAPGAVRFWRPTIKILIAVWGESYIRRFEALSLSSILSPNNLPALAEHCDVEFVFLTRRSEFEHFAGLDLMTRIQEHASIRYEAIDDLIVPGLYTVTLTLAFTRGMRIFGQAMTEMHFMYWNADFVIGDGSLRHLRRCVAEGRHLVLAGSVRVISEEVEPALRRRIGADGVLDASPRELMRHLYEHPHLMQVAKTVNQSFCWARHPNHLFWNVDGQTTIARFFQIFMFCIRPTRVRLTMDGYCDYSFVPAFCPGEPIHVVQDSDDICLLELQGRWQEAEDVLFGPGRDEAWLASIDEWCTPEHAEIARRPIVYHSGDLGPALDGALAESAGFVEDVLKRIRDPAPHPGHYYWIYGVAAWNLRRSEQEALAGWPPELDMRLPVGALKHPSFDYDRGRRALPPAAAPSGWYGRLKRAVVGEAPEITRLHPDFAALAPLIHAARQVRSRLREQPGYTILLVAELGSWIDRILTLHEGHVYRTEPLIAATWRFEPEPAVDEVVIYQARGSAADLEKMIKNVAPALRSGGRLTVLRHYPIYAEADLVEVARDRLGFAVAPYAHKVMALHTASEGRVRYARGLPGHARRLHGRSMLGRAWGAVAASMGLARSYGRSTPARPAAAVFTARSLDTTG